ALSEGRAAGHQRSGFATKVKRREQAHRSQTRQPPVVRDARRSMAGERSVTSDNSHLPIESTVVDQSLGRQGRLACAGARQTSPRAADSQRPPHGSARFVAHPQLPNDDNVTRNLSVASSLPPRSS